MEFKATPARKSCFHILLVLSSLSSKAVSSFSSSSSSPFRDLPASIASGSSSSCRRFLSDPCWPSSAEWEAFNRTLQGRLISTVPIASVCHDDPFAVFDAEECTNLRSRWFLEETHYRSSSSIMAPFFANQSYGPFLPRKARYFLGTYIRYAVSVSRVSDVVNTIEFIERHNIRLTIRNTRHDYNAKATGAGALGIRAHYLKSITFLNYSSDDYTGPALRMGAGVQPFEAY